MIVWHPFSVIAEQKAKLASLFQQSKLCCREESRSSDYYSETKGEILRFTQNDR